MDKDGVACPPGPRSGSDSSRSARSPCIRSPATTGPGVPAALVRGRDQPDGLQQRGRAALADRLATCRALGVPLGISLGKSKVTPLDQAVGDYLASLRQLAPVR
jgi:dihydroorotate dehydrogenase